MPAEEVLAELRFAYDSLSTGVPASIGLFRKLDSQIDTSTAQLQDKSKAAFAVFARESKIAAEQYREFASEIVKQNQGLSFEAISDKLFDVGKAGLGAFKGSVNAAAELEKVALSGQATFGLTASQLEEMTEKANAMRKEMGLSVTTAEAVATQFEAMSSGFQSAGDSSQVMVSSLALAQAGGADTSQTLKAITGALNTYGMSADQAMMVSDLFFQIVKDGRASVSELAAGFGQVAPTAAAAGISMQELAAAVATASNSQETSSALIGVRGVIAALIKPTKEAKDAMAQFGLSIDGETLKSDGLTKTLQKIKAAVGDNSTAFKTIIADSEAFTTAAILMGDSGNQLAATFENMQSSAGNTKKALEVTSGGLQQSSKQFKTSVESLSASASKTFLPAVTALVKGSNGIVNAIDGLPQPIKTAGLAILGIGSACTLAAGGAAFLAFTLPTVQGALVAIAARAVPMAVASMGLLNVQFGLFNTIVGGLTLLGKGIVGFFNGIGVAISAAASAMSFIAGATGVLTLAFAGLGSAVAIGIVAYTDLENQVTAANEAILKSQDIRKMDPKRKVIGNRSLSTTEILSSSASDLAKKGVNSDTLTQRIVDEQNAQELALKNGQKELADRAAERMAKLRKIRSELQEELKKQAELKPPTPKVENQKEQKAAEKAEKKAQDDAYRNDLQRIDLGKAGHAEKIKQLEELRKKYSLDGNEQRQLNKAIADEQNKLREETAKKAKEARQEEIKQARQEIENSAKPEQEKVKALRGLIIQYKLVGDERRSIEDKVFQYEESIRKKREDAIKAERDLYKEQSNQRVKDSEIRLGQLDLREGRGGNVLGDRVAELRKQAKEQAVQVDLELKNDIQGQTDEGVIRNAELKAKNAKLQIQQELQLELDRLQQEGVEKEISRRQELVAAEQRIKSTTIELIKERVTAGLSSEKELEAAILSRLALQEEEIRLQAEAAKRQTEDPKRVEQIEKEAQAAILQARRASREEIEKTTKALEEQQAKQRASKDGFTLGKVTGIEGLNDYSAFDITKNPNAPKRDPFNALPQLDTRKIQDSLLGLKPGARSVYDMEQRGGSPAITVAPTKIDLTLRNEKGDTIDFKVNSVTNGGRNSDLTRELRGML